jgi:hypothetical protein
MPRVLQRFPGHLQKLAVLRVHDGRFLGAEPEEVGVELLETLQRRRRGHVVAVPHAFRALAGGQQFGLAQSADGFDTLAQVGPVGLKMAAPGRWAAMPTMAMSLEASEGVVTQISQVDIPGPAPIG